MPLVHKKFLQLDPKEMRDVLAKGLKGKQIMADIVAEADSEWAEYKLEDEEEL